MPGFGGWRPAPPCLPTPQLRSPETCHLRHPRAKSGMSLSSFHLLDDLLQLRRHFRKRLATDLHGSVLATPNHQVDLAQRAVLLGKIFAEMSAATFFPLHSRARDGFGNSEKVLQIQCGMPAR